MAQIVPAEIGDPGQGQGLLPRLRAHLLDGLASIGEHVGRVAIALATEHLQRIGVERDAQRPAGLVAIGRHHLSIRYCDGSLVWPLEMTILSSCE